MKKLFLFLLLCGGLDLAAAIGVVLPEKTDQSERIALEELKLFLPKALGKKIKILSEKSGRGDIYLGNTRLAAKHGLTSDKMTSEEWCVQTVDGKLVINGGRGTGIIYAVLEFAEKELGVVYASEDCTYIPSRKNYTFKKKISLRGKPAFDVRGIYSYFGKDHGARIRFCLRSRLNLFFDEKHPEAAKQWGIEPVYGSPRPCHNFYNYTKDLPKKDWDILSRNSAGKPVRAVNNSGPGQVCYSNPKTRQFFKRKLAEYIKADNASGKGAKVYVLDPNDNPSRCLCAACRRKEKQYGGFSGVMLEFLNDIAASFPEKEILSSAYMGTEKTPKRGIVPAKNVTIRLAQLGTEWGNLRNRDTMRSLALPRNKNSMAQIREWSRIGKLAIWDYWILYGGKSDFPTLNTRAIWENSRIYRKQGVSSYFAECEEVHIVSFHALRLWLGAQCMKNPDFEFEAAVKRFMKAYYGPAAETMFKCHAYLEKRFAALKATPGECDAYRRSDLDQAFFKEMDRLLDAAEKRVANEPQYLARVKKERLSIDYARLARRREIGLKNTAPVVKRLRENAGVVSRFPEVSAGRSKKFAAKLNNFIEGLQVSAPLPGFLKDYEVVADFPWPLLTRKARYVVLEEDKAAVGDKAVVFKANRFHKKPLKFGVYDAAGRRQLKSLQPKEIAKPGFNYYATGQFTLTNNCFIWIHPSWNLQADLSRYYDTSGLKNEVEAFISIRTKPYFAVDRVIVARKRK